MISQVFAQLSAPIDDFDERFFCRHRANSSLYTAKGDKRHYGNSNQYSLDQDQKSAGLPCATKYRHETSQNTGARRFTMPLVMEAYRCTASSGKWWCVLAGASFLIVLTALKAAPTGGTLGQAAADWVQEYGSRNKDCLEWSDTCVNCVRAQPGENFSCSNVGIACQPKEVGQARAMLLLLSIRAPNAHQTDLAVCGKTFLRLPNGLGDSGLFAFCTLLVHAQISKSGAEREFFSKLLDNIDIDQAKISRYISRFLQLCQLTWINTRGSLHR